MNNNGTTMIALVIIGFIVLIITGKFVLNNESNSPIFVKPDRPIVVRPHFTRPVDPCPEHHNKNDFWVGYNDAWNRIPPRASSTPYTRGYEIGLRDRRANRREYYDQHCPPGLRIRTPGFRLDIR